MHDGDHEILEGHHDEHYREQKSDRVVKLVAGLIAVGLIAAFILWKLV